MLSFVSRRAWRRKEGGGAVRGSAPPCEQNSLRSRQSATLPFKRDKSAILPNDESGFLSVLGVSGAWRKAHCLRNSKTPRSESNIQSYLMYIPARVRTGAGYSSYSSMQMRHLKNRCGGRGLRSGWQMPVAGLTGYSAERDQSVRSSAARTLTVAPSVFARGGSFT